MFLFCADSVLINFLGGDGNDTTHKSTGRVAKGAHGQLS